MRPKPSAAGQRQCCVLVLSAPNSRYELSSQAGVLPGSTSQQHVRLSNMSVLCYASYCAIAHNCNCTANGNGYATAGAQDALISSNSGSALAARCHRHCKTTRDLRANNASYSVPNPCKTLKPLQPSGDRLVTFDRLGNP